MKTEPLFSNAIGVFDSGVGGLSVLRAIRQALPHERFIYVADSGHAPYGSQTQSHITERTLGIGAWLAQQQAKAITIACNTATVVAAKALREHIQIPVVAIEPAIKPALALTRSGVVGVLATTQTVQSEAVARLVQAHGAGKQVLLQACPGLVEQVERAELDSAHTEALLRQFIMPLLAQGADTLVLGCTHYPFLREAMERVVRECVGEGEGEGVGVGVVLLDPAEAVARELVRRLSEQGALTLPADEGCVQFFTSGDVGQAQAVMSQLWGEPLAVQALPAFSRNAP